jgi:low temperature requirement protein LtrA
VDEAAMAEQGMAMEREHRITPLELFFDLVFVYAFTQVTMVFTDDTSWAGLAHGVLILAALWWAWAAYAWLTNTIDAGQDAVLAALLVALVAMFVAALAVPETFGRHGVLFGAAFFVVTVMHLAVYALSARPDQELFGAVLRLSPSNLLGAVLILAAGFAPDGVKSLLWLLALVLGFGAPLLTRTMGWRLEPAHFVERHGLIVIIAIGESLIAIGLGAAGTDLGPGVIAAAVLGLLVATSFWLAYFDYFPIRAQQLLAERSGHDRTALARDVYSYLHLPMVCGIVLFAFALKVTLAHVGQELETIPAFALCAGPAMYLLAFALVRLRVSGSLGRGRAIAAAAFAALFPVALAVPALVGLALVAAIWFCLHAYEIIWWREARAEARALRTNGGPA